MTKVKLLVNFGYYRKQWIDPFERLKDQFELVYLFHIHPSQESQIYTDERIVYWSDFSGAYDLLDQEKPDRIIFMDVTSGLTIALNLAAKHSGITTFILQHGLYHNYTDYRQREIKSKQNRQKEKSTTNKPCFEFSTLSFMKNSLKSSDLFLLPKLLCYLYIQRKEGFNYASKKVRFEARKPKYYICYSPDNALIHRELDGDIEHRCHYIGNPELFRLNKEISQSACHKVDDDYYYLLIDQPFADNRFGEHIKTRKEMTDFYKGLSAWCRQNNSRLVVKLHPESFHSDWLPEREGIKWVKETENMAMLISNSIGCFGFFSTLILPVIAHKPTVLFKVGNSPLYDSISSLKAAQVLPFGAFDDIDLKRNNKRNTEGFIYRYFYQNEIDPVALMAQILDK
ncbi:MAG: hypothetical protein JJ909_07365 [Roseivirga sp.]|uniref:hypothetical protein n=1 Tax=Roseivirga sp. TaxID=1964215 RepID=UPI001B14DFFC|nr:hypothetical protein [Roseivirga sp.]MBO6660490.1 hypothetical protein [Roseivirga sp.]MBO6760773.1 hypothetical protein [Roseivirga sp.]MBO6906773.1 hypothetical protein [Roseivirga sp.]